jgi:hypothetical protein
VAVPEPEPASDRHRDVHRGSDRRPLGSPIDGMPARDGYPDRCGDDPRRDDPAQQCDRHPDEDEVAQGDRHRDSSGCHEDDRRQADSHTHSDPYGRPEVHPGHGDCHRDRGSATHVDAHVVVRVAPLTDVSRWVDSP